MNEFHREISNDESRARRGIPLGSGGCECNRHVFPVLSNRSLQRGKRQHGVGYCRRNKRGILCNIGCRIRHCKHPQEHTQMVDRRRERQ